MADCGRHVIERILNPRFLSQMASDDVASTIHQALPRIDLPTVAARATTLEMARSRIPPAFK